MTVTVFTRAIPYTCVVFGSRCPIHIQEPTKGRETMKGTEKTGSFMDSTRESVQRTNMKTRIDRFAQLGSLSAAVATLSLSGLLLGGFCAVSRADALSGKSDSILVRAGKTGAASVIVRLESDLTAE